MTLFDVLLQPVSKHVQSAGAVIVGDPDTPQGTLLEKKRSKLVQATGYRNSKQLFFFYEHQSDFQQAAKLAEPLLIDR